MAVTEQAGIFEEFGLDVELVFFAHYLAGIDAMAVGELDFVTQTLNETMASLAFVTSRSSSWSLVTTSRAMCYICSAERGFRSWC